jgi:hypothetical protein
MGARPAAGVPGDREDDGLKAGKRVVQLYYRYRCLKTDRSLGRHCPRRAGQPNRPGAVTTRTAGRATLDAAEAVATVRAQAHGPTMNLLGRELSGADRRHGATQLVSEGEPKGNGTAGRPGILATPPGLRIAGTPSYLGTDEWPFPRPDRPPGPRLARGPQYGP